MVRWIARENEVFASEKKQVIVDFVRSLISVEGNLMLGKVEYDEKGGVTLKGYKRISKTQVDHVQFYIEPNEIQDLMNLHTIEDMFEYYLKMGYFQRHGYFYNIMEIGKYRKNT